LPASGIYDTWFHGARWAPPLPAAPVRTYAAMQRGAAQFDYFKRFKRVFNNQYLWKLHKLYMILQALDAPFNIV